MNPNGSCCSLPAMMEDTKKKVAGLVERKTFKVDLKEDLPQDANICLRRFVLEIKSTEDNKIKFKARFVIGGHRDKLKKLKVRRIM